MLWVDSIGYREKERPGDPDKQHWIVSVRGRIQSDVQWSLWDWAGNGGCSKRETQWHLVSWHAGWEDGGEGVGTDAKSFSFGNRIDWANAELQNVRDKCFVKEGFEDTLNYRYLCVSRSVRSTSTRNRSEAQETKGWTSALKVMAPSKMITTTIIEWNFPENTAYQKRKEDVSLPAGRACRKRSSVEKQRQRGWGGGLRGKIAVSVS